MTLEPLLWLHCSIPGRCLLAYIIGNQSGCGGTDLELFGAAEEVCALAVVCLRLRPHLGEPSRVRHDARPFFPPSRRCLALSHMIWFHQNDEIVRQFPWSTVQICQFLE